MKLSWSKLTPKPDPRHGKPCTRSSHGLSVVNNGTKLILYGGEHVARTPLGTDQALWVADLMEGNTWVWRLIEKSGEGAVVVPPARVAHAQAVVNGTKLYIWGGRAGIQMQEAAMDDMWVFDIETEKWNQVDCDGGDDDIPEARSFHKMVSVGTDLYMFGGCGATSGRLNDMHKFDTKTSTWSDLGKSEFLRGRGGPNLMTFACQTKLGVVAGFAGEETNDGHLFDIATSKWESEALTPRLDGLRPRSVCVNGSFPSTGMSIIFGGEVDPSAKGHEGAGGFTNDVVCLKEMTGEHLETIKPSGDNNWPETRGWSDADGIDHGNGTGSLYIFGGLSGDDTNPTRLDDLWRLDISK